jgi:Rps23 Pro-64 3,4-dihydroxylase Tpa1-like proline 4-hydroxylase
MLDMCKYVPGGHLGFHYDGIDGDRSLLYTIVMYFNEDYEGGELSFTVMEEGKQRASKDLDDPNIDF